MQEMHDDIAVLQDKLHDAVLLSNATNQVQVPDTPSSEADGGDVADVCYGKGKDKGKKGKGKGQQHGGWLPRCVKLAQSYLQRNWYACDELIDDYQRYDGFQKEMQRWIGGESALVSIDNCKASYNITIIQIIINYYCHHIPQLSGHLCNCILIAIAMLLVVAITVYTIHSELDQVTVKSKFCL